MLAWNTSWTEMSTPIHIYCLEFCLCRCNEDRVNWINMMDIVIRQVWHRDAIDSHTSWRLKHIYSTSVGCWGSLHAARRRQAKTHRDVPSELAPSYCLHSRTLTSENKVLSFEANMCMVVCYGSPRKAIQSAMPPLIISWTWTGGQAWWLHAQYLGGRGRWDQL